LTAFQLLILDNSALLSFTYGYNLRMLWQCYITAHYSKKAMLRLFNSVLLSLTCIFKGRTNLKLS